MYFSYEECRCDAQDCANGEMALVYVVRVGLAAFSYQVREPNESDEVVEVIQPDDWSSDDIAAYENEMHK